MICESEQVRDSILLDRGLGEHKIRAEEDTVDEYPCVIRRMTWQRNDLDRCAEELLHADLDNPIHRARLGEQEAVTQGIHWIGAAEEEGWLEDGMPDHGRFDIRRPDFAAGALPHKRICAKVIRVPMSVEDRDDFGSQLVPNRSQHLARGRVIEAAVDQCDVSIVVSDDADIRAAGNVPDPVAQGNIHEVSVAPTLVESALYSSVAYMSGQGEGTMLVKHIVAVEQFDREWILDLFGEADRMKSVSASDGLLNDRILATLFYEPSTRTRLSFESAMLRLGGQVISTENAREFSSAIKGETVEDTVRIVAGYADGIVIRHYEQGAASRAAAVSQVPIINGGDGPGEHPTQALLDFYTIHDELGQLDHLTVALVGDLRFGRAVRSLALMFRLTSNVELLFVSPEAVPMGDDVRKALDSAGVRYRDEPDLAKALRVSNVVYQTRIQRERFATQDEYRAAQGIYVVNEESLDLLGPGAIVMHPLPRVEEISSAVDADPRAAYFRQARNGVYIRMALLNQLLGASASAT